jgi:hypothetical protein
LTEPGTVTWFHAEPSYPQKLDVLDRSVGSLRTRVQDIGVEYTKHSSIPVRVRLGAVLLGEYHDITMRAGVHRVLISANVVCCIVHAKSLRGINSVVDYSD